MAKILHLSHTDIRSDSRILKEIHSLAGVGNEVSGIGVVLDDGSTASESARDLDIIAIVLKSRKFTILPRLLRHLLTLLELTVKMFFKAVKRRPDIVHCNDTLVLPLGVLVKIFTRAKVIYDAHELESDRNGLSKLQGKLTLLVEKMLWKFTDALIVVSPSIQDWYIQNIGYKNSEVILNSPAIEETSDGDTSSYLRDYFGIPEKSKVFLYVGIFAPGRGIDLITEVFKDPNLSSSIVFLGYGELSESLKKLAIEHKNIYVHDAVPHDKVVSVATSADVGFCLIQNVSLSDYFCLPNKLFEYCFAGIPVLASNFPDIANTVNEFKIGICCDLDITSIRRAIDMYEKGQVDVDFHVKDLSELSWQAQEVKLRSLYERVL